MKPKEKKCKDKNIIRVCTKYGSDSPFCKKIITECKKEVKK